MDAALECDGERAEWLAVWELGLMAWKSWNVLGQLFVKQSER